MGEKAGHVSRPVLGRRYSPMLGARLFVQRRRPVAAAAAAGRPPLQRGRKGEEGWNQEEEEREDQKSVGQGDCVQRDAARWAKSARVVKYNEAWCDVGRAGVGDSSEAAQRSNRKRADCWCLIM